MKGGWKIASFNSAAAADLFARNLLEDLASYEVGEFEDPGFYHLWGKDYGGARFGIFISHALRERLYAANLVGRNETRDDGQLNESEFYEVE